MRLTKSLIICIIFSLSAFFTGARAEESQDYQVDDIIKGDYTQAEQELLEVLRKDPEDPFALLNLAFVYQSSGQDVKAREIYQRILVQSENPHAQLASGKPQRVKTIAQRGIAQLDSK